MPWPLDTSRSAARFARLQAGLAQRYRLERELGPAGPITTFVARDLTSDRPVALKLFDPYRTAAAGPARLLRALEAAGRVQDQHLLAPLDTGVVRGAEGQSVYYTVPFLAGESLRARIDREVQLPVADALAIAEDVAGAIAAAHAQGIAHGAIAPESVVLAGGQALLADLGVAAGLDGDPPDPRDDVRGIGRLLYEMLSGAPPGHGVPAPLRAGRAGIPEEVELTVAQLLAPPPGGYGTAEQARTAIRNASAAARAVSLPGTTTAERVALRRRLPPRWAFFTFSVLALLGASLWLRYSRPAVVQPPTPPVRPGSVVVLPFDNATPDTANRIFSDGLTRELTAALGGVPGLRVAGETSAFRLARTGLDPRRVGERLGVGAVLRGSVRHAEGRLRVRASLTHVREGFDLWSETYERDVAELPAVRREIAAAVAGALRLPPPRGTSAVTAPEVHAVYLRGLLAARAGDTAAVPLLEAAVRLDSTFAPGWAVLAEAVLRAGTRDTLRPADVAREARAAAERALALDSTLPSAHAALGTVRFLHDWDWPGAEAMLRQSIALDPNRPDTYLRLAHLLQATGRVDEAAELGRWALELSPFDPAVRLHLARQALHVGDYVGAGEELERAAALQPEGREVDLLRGLIAAATGRYADALPPLERAAAADSAQGDEARAMLAWVDAIAGRRDEARDVQAALQEAAAARYVSGYYLAFIADALGDRRGAFAALDRALADHAPELVDLRIDPRMDRLRVDRRFDAVARRIGLP